MMKKVSLLVAAAVGYVLGSRAGRERYEQIKSGAQRFASNPKVQSARDRAQDTAATQAKHAAEVAKDKADGVASSVTDKVRRDSSIQPGP